MKTQAITFTSQGVAALETIELPDAGPTDVSVQLEVSGVSVGTERWALLGKRPEMAFPHVPGYMGIGRITAVGAVAASCGWREGQRINFACSRLPAPYAGNSWMGTHLAHAVVDVTAGREGRDGPHHFFRAEPLPEGLDPLDSALTQLCGVALRGIEMARIPAGGTVLVVGAGVIGQFAAQICRLKGARVMVSDVVRSRLDIAARLGAAWTVDPSREDLAARAAAAAPGGFDVIIDTASIPSVVNAAVPLLRVGGQIIFQGWYPPPSALDLHAMHIRQPTCHFPCGHSGRHVAQAMLWTRDRLIDARSLLDRVVRPGEAPEFYRHMAGSSEAFLGAAIDWRNA
ncbi:MAG: zinc-binding alcohol dehydrogenase [Planctomycetes bacterium]|nr:zinc-binding alcohol dehydrogenase [Planctomycetota bacterium]